MAVAAAKRNAISTKVLAIIAVVVTIIALLAFIIAAGVKEKQRLSYTGSDQYLIDQAEASVRATLRDPASAVFSEQRVLGTGPDQRVCGLVNAKNGFGGYAGEQRFVSFLGAVAFVGEERPDTPLWTRPEHPCDVF